MTSVQIKDEIQKVLDQVPETALSDILDFVKKLQINSPDQIKLEHDLEKTISEDAGLLHRLAQ
ncbi:hypothetical protein [Mucilaginibacter dorajii]|uniref:DUF2281 domain-containing protein n=1 Tax=Mucilaginibacter dorajii TaxID=692994 RepID=A0ABP7QM17_9SPHI|nr:hypothetical protein [Mucilaginibacter dorajii]MCS3735892.1 mRNA-degrading endonuclease RelE of RelBE toxin-antitoxin system [Mucilaginibacter dorajii]